jgi:ABC-type multidrug transport system permease subunit
MLCGDFSNKADEKMKYIQSNINALIKKEKIIFLVIIICSVLSSFILNFSYGLYKNFQTAKLVETESLNTIALEINKEYAPTHGQVREFVESLSEDTLSETSFYVSGTIEELKEENYPYLESRFTFRNGSYAIPSAFRKNSEDALSYGRMLTDEEEQSGALVACIETNGISTEPAESVQSLIQGNTLTFQGQEYEIVGGDTLVSEMSIPFLSIPDDFVYDDVVILDFERTLTRSMYEDIINTAEEAMPRALTFPELKLPDNDTLSIFDNILIIAILISFISACNFVLLYHFILSKRNRDLAIFRICGSSRMNCYRIYLGECLIYSIPCYLVGGGVYYILLKSTLCKIYPYILDTYSLKITLYIFLLYLLILLIVVSILIISHINKPIVAELKEKKV